MKNKKIRVALGGRSYTISVAAGLLDGVREYIPNLAHFGRIALVTDENVEPLYAERLLRSFAPCNIPIDLFVVPAGEESKSPEVVATLWESFLDARLGRDGLVVALGGGVVGDLAGFAAATFARGIGFVQVPTTLLAMTDSSVGGKTGIDLGAAKNMAGAFHQPLAVVIDPETLATLPDRSYRAGLGEVVKYGFSLDETFFQFLEANVAAINRRDGDVLTELIARCCAIKGKIVRADERETGTVRALLNYGHTFGHAYESAGGYSLLLHGEGVVLGMLDAVHLARRLARRGVADFAGVDDALVRRQKRLLRQLGLATTRDELIPALKKFSPPKKWSPEALFDRMKLDKKAKNGTPRFVLPTGPGTSALFDAIPREMVLEVLATSKK